MSLVAGEGSKDTWILSDAPVEQVTLLPTRGESLKLIRSKGDLPSRVADNLYWLGRHLERADSSARLLRRIALRMTSETGSAKYADLPYLIRCLAEQGQIEPGYAIEGIKEQLPAIEQSLAAAVFDDQQLGSLRSILDETFRIASNVRDRLSVDSWRIVVHLDADFQTAHGRRLRLVGRVESGQRADHRLGGLRRDCHREHDADARLSLPGNRSAAGTFAADPDVNQQLFHRCRSTSRTNCWNRSWKSPTVA